MGLTVFKGSVGFSGTIENKNKKTHYFYIVSTINQGLIKVDLIKKDIILIELGPLFY